MNLRFDFSDFERVARNMDAFADQIPFALSRAMNDAADDTRTKLIEETWPTHVQARNRSFMRAALTTKGQRATKRKLQVTIYDKLGRGNLSLHSKGGTRQASRGTIAVPSRVVKVRRSGKGVPAGLKPRALPNSFRKGDSIYQRMPKTKKVKAHIRLMYTLKPSVRISPDVPFEADFRSTMQRRVFERFGPRIREAMKSRFG